MYISCKKYLIEERKQNELSSKKHKKVYKISAFASSVGIPVFIASSKVSEF